MNRHRHYLEPTKADRWPSVIACVACEGKLSDSDNDSCDGVETLAEWSVRLLARIDGQYHIRGGHVAYDAAEFWPFVEALSESVGYLWLLSSNAARDWSLLGLWERVENGAIYIVGTDPRETKDKERRLRDLRQTVRSELRYPSAGSVSRLRDRRQGYIVFQDAPNIVRLRPASGRKWLQWVDIRNYGVAAPTGSRTAYQQSVDLANTMLEISESLSLYRMGSLQATVSSQAMHGFRRTYYTGGIYVHSHESALGIEQQAYYGGRCECYQVGPIGAPLWHCDIRSSYGFSMARALLPVRLRGYTDNPSECEAIGRRDPNAGIARITIETNDEAYPYRRAGNKADDTSFERSRTYGVGHAADTDIIYPIGRFTTTLAGPELADCVRAGRVVSWHALAWYDIEPVLRDYALCMYNMREYGDRIGSKVISALAKSLLVSLPGKFGQRDRRWIDCPEVWTDQQYGEWYGGDGKGNTVRYRAIAGNVQRDSVLGWAHNACPAIAAFICSDARMHLLELIRLIGWEHVYYCDTDSLMVDEHGYNLLASKHGHDSGELGTVYRKSGPNDVTIRGGKNYTEDGKVVCAGMSFGDRQDREGVAGSYRYLTPAEQIRRESRPQAKLIAVKYDRTEQYRHRIVNADGKTRPIELREV